MKSIKVIYSKDFIVILKNDKEVYREFIFKNSDDKFVLFDGYIRVANDGRRQYSQKCNSEDIKSYYINAGGSEEYTIEAIEEFD